MCFDLVSRRTLPRLRLILGIPLASAIAFGVLGFSLDFPFCGWSSGTHFQLCLFRLLLQHDDLYSCRQRLYRLSRVRGMEWHLRIMVAKDYGMPSWAYSAAPMSLRFLAISTSTERYLRCEYAMDNEFESVRIGENCLLGSGKVLRINLDLFLVG